MLVVFSPSILKNSDQSRVNHSEFQRCFRLAKSTAGLETVLLFFSETNRSFKEKTAWRLYTY